MGHDIYAETWQPESLARIAEYPDDEAREILENGVPLGELDERMLQVRLYDTMAQHGDAIPFRRSAFDPYASIIYQALGAMDLHSGMSGDHAHRSFTREEIETALHSLNSIKPIQPDQDLLQKVMDDVTKEFSSPGLADSARPGPLDDKVPSTAHEQRFLTAVLAWMRDNNQPTVRIYFG